MSYVAIIDYGMGNLRSVAKAVEHVFPGGDVRVTHDPKVVDGAAQVIFPGQGAMPDCMRELEARGLREAVMAAAANKPFLGICIGLQMLFERSEEGNEPGLGLLSGEVVRFSAELRSQEGARLKVPHMGWNEVRQDQSHPLWAGIESGTRFYFVHSYFPVPAQSQLEVGRTTYGVSFCCAVARNNLFAVQFHPEKSQAAGLRLLSNFVAWDGKFV
ncbi:MAG: imidazole glycerol phosphate synthase subunit HisH [Betaproteobacteria bacterium]|nr:imidazole glycerol phosphate synthase subunit HisH [Betaproteobacteria bacterium]